jgi:hypothetical protein
MTIGSAYLYLKRSKEMNTRSSTRGLLELLGDLLCLRKIKMQIRVVEMLNDYIHAVPGPKEKHVIGITPLARPKSLYRKPGNLSVCKQQNICVESDGSTPSEQIW